ncbi:restriction endonuclease subunit S [Aeromonas sp. R4-3]|uniref:restriction endonuclease subunit S n=1 Tax=Aeromonas sp. R4-3 TaxID=3138466 RepID=UPI0034A4448E
MSQAVATQQQKLIGRYRPYPEYKDSGVIWSGFIPSHWEPIRFKHVFVEKPKTSNIELPAGSISFGQVVFKDEEKLAEETKASYQEVKVGEFLVNPLNLNFDLKSLRTALSEIDVVVSTGYIVLQCYRQLEARYARWLLHEFDVAHMKSLGAGVRQTIGFNDIGNSYFCMPRLEEQLTIAAFLDHETSRIDRLIAQQQRLIELLKEKRQAVISHAVTKGLNPNAPMKDSGVEWLGQVPEHWVVGPIKYTLQSKKGACKAGPFGSHLTNADMTGSDVKVITQRNVIDDDMEVGDSYISSDKYKELRAFTIQKGDILVTTRGTIGRTALFQQEYTAILHPCLIRLQADGAILIPEWLSLLIQESGYVVEQILIKSNATTIEVIYSESLLNVDIAYPPSESEQIDVLDFINCQKMKFQHLISAAGRAISLMQERRIALISAAVTGKIDLRGWTQPAEEVAA